MLVSIDQVEGKVPVSIITLRGELDASNYELLIDKAREVYQSGERYLLLDMSELNFMSSAGLVALHSVALLFRGEAPHDLESGWDAFHAIGRDLDSGFQPSVKLLNPQTRVSDTLQKTGFNRFFEIYSDQQTALDSFRP